MSEYIRQQDAIDDLHTQLMYRMGSDDMKRRLDDWVKTLPSADVAPVVHARWRHYEGMYACEACGAQIDDESPFCPMCGAKMYEGDEYG